MSTKRRLRRKQCGDKVRHASRADAEMACRSVAQAHKLDTNLRPYLCQWCRRWHIGHRGQFAG